MTKVGRLLYYLLADTFNHQARIVTSTALEAISSSDPQYLYTLREGYDSGFKLFADDNYRYTQRMPVVVHRVNDYQLLITPTEGIYPDNSQIEIQPWTQRVFTIVSPQIPVLSTLSSILTDYAGYFIEPAGRYGDNPMVGAYFDWIKPDGSTVELLGGKIHYRVWGDSAKMGDQMEAEFKSYFISEGYSLSTANSVEGVPSSSANPLPKNVVGLQKDNTVCKLINSQGSKFAIYCGILVD